MLCLVEIFAEFNDPGTECGDGGILVLRIIVRNVNRRRNAVASRGEGDGLSMIAAGRRNDAGGLRMRLAQPIQIYKTAANFECARGRVIFMFHPDCAAGAAAKFGPCILRRSRHYLVNELCSTLQLGHVERYFLRMHNDSF